MSAVDVSVVIPVYNGGAFLEETLRTVAGPSGCSQEIVVVDDGSTDDTPHILRSWNERVKALRLTKNCGGPARPRNVGIESARGKFIALFDSDDLMRPGKIARQADFLEAHDDIPFVFTDFRNLSDEGPAAESFLNDHGDFQNIKKQELIDGWRLSKNEAFSALLLDNYIGTSSVMFRRSLFYEMGGFDENLGNSDDIDFFFRVARRCDLGFIDDILHERRIHARNISSRPQALEARLKVRMKWKDAALTPRETRALNVSLARIHFSLGHVEKAQGHRRQALSHWLASWRLDKGRWKTYKSMAGALLPFSR